MSVRAVPLSLFLFLLLPLAACSGGNPRTGVSADAECIHRLYDYPLRQMPFQNAAGACAPDHPLDLTGNAYFQQLATSLNVPFVARDKGRPITLTGSRLATPSDQLPPPTLQLR